MKTITTVTEFNKQQDINYNEYCNQCKSNGVEPQKRDLFNQFITFDYKRGFVLCGPYPIYKKRKKDLL